MTKALFRSELRKAVRAKSTWAILAALVAVVVLGVLQTGAPAEAAKSIWERQFYFLATFNGTVFLVVLGAKLVTDEFRYGTIVSTLLVTPRRERVVAAKLAVVGLLGLLGAAVTAVAMTVVAMSTTELTMQAADIRALGGFVLAGAFLATIGAAIGLVVRHQVAAIVGSIVWFFAVEQILQSAGDGLRNYLPGAASGGLAAAATLRGMVVSALTLAAYVGASAIVAGVTMRRRDVI